MLNGARLMRTVMAALAPLLLAVSMLAAYGSAAAKPAPLVPAASATDDCMGAATHPNIPARTAPPCAADCPLVCSPILPEGPAASGPVRESARLSFRFAPSVGQGVSYDPDYPPPRSVSA